MSDLRNKRLLILGGASQHCKVVEAAKRLGVETFVADFLPSAPAKDMADHAYQINVTDTDSLVELCRSEGIDGVLSGWLDFCQVPYQHLCEAAGFPCYGTREQFEVLTNKVRFKRLCEQHGVGHPTAFDWERWIGGPARSLPYAVFVKPADSRGSRGATVCRTSVELEAAVRIAQEESFDGHAVAERYIENAHPFLAVYFFVNGRPVLQQLSDAYFGDPEYGMEKINVAYSSPSRSSELFLEKAQQPFLQAMDALGIENGPVCMQGFFTADDVLFFDPGRRFPGGEYERAFYRETGIDLVEAMIEFALTGVMPEIDSLPENAFLLNGGFVTRLQLNVRGGTVAAVSGLDVVSDMPEVEYVAPYHAVGDRIEDSGDVRQRFAQVVLVAKSRKQMNRAIDDVYASVRILDDFGNEMLIASSSSDIAGGGVVIRDSVSITRLDSMRFACRDRSVDWAAFPDRRSAVVLAGGLPQRKMVLSLRRRGYRVAVVDWNDHATAEEVADTYYRESTLDEQAVRQIVIRERGGILATCCTDQALCTMGRVAEGLGISTYLSSAESILVTNKLAMKRNFLQAGVPSARFIENPIDSHDVPFPFPVVVKPADCNSSRGVTKAENAAECDEAIKQARSLSRTRNVIVEEFIEGSEYSIDAFVVDGRPTILCVSRSDKLRLGDGFVICRGQYIPQVHRRLGAECQKIAERIVAGFGLVNCPLLIQAIETKGNLMVLEFSARTGGSIKYRLIERACGVDVIEATVDLICGVIPAIEPSMSGSVISNEFLYCKEGFIGEVRGFERCMRERLISEYNVFKAPGSFSKGARDSGDRVAAFTIVANSIEEYRNALSRVMSFIDVVDADGRSMLVQSAA